MGTERESFIELTERIGRKTGGLSVSPFVSSVKGSPDPVAYLMLRGKVGGGGPLAVRKRWQRAGI